MKVGKELKAGIKEGGKELFSEATTIKEPLKYAIFGIFGVGLDNLMDKGINFISKKTGIENMATWKRILLKIGIPASISALFIAGKIKFGKLVASVGITSIITTIFKESLNFLQGKMKTTDGDVVLLPESGIQISSPIRFTLPFTGSSLGRIRLL